MPAAELRKLTREHPEFISDALEADERAIDEAKAAIRAGMQAEDKKTRLASAAAFLMLSEVARRRFR